MKKKLLILIMAFISLLLIRQISFADECPFDQVNCEGQCGRFSDSNSDEFCDLGELSIEQKDKTVIQINEEELKQKTVIEVADLFSINVDKLINQIETQFGAKEVKKNSNLGELHDTYNVCMTSLMSIIKAIKDDKEIKIEPSEISGTELKKMTIKQTAEFYQADPEQLVEEIKNTFQLKNISPNDNLGELHDNQGVEMHAVKGIGKKLREQNITQLSNSQIEKKPEKKTIGQIIREKYKFWELSLITIILYSISFILLKLKKISLKIHKMIWNLILLIVFLTSGIIGMLLAMGIKLSLPFGTTLEIHVWSGIIMFWICLFHVLEHWRFFYNCFCKRRK